MACLGRASQGGEPRNVTSGRLPENLSSFLSGRRLAHLPHVEFWSGPGLARPESGRPSNGTADRSPGR